MRRPFWAFAALLFLAALAPFLASGTPWIASGPDGGWVFPAFAALDWVDLGALAVAMAAVGFCASRAHRRWFLRAAFFLLCVLMWHQPRVFNGNGDVVVGALVPHDPGTRDFKATRVMSLSNTSHPLGTDSSGRDLASRTLHGLRVSISVALVTTVAATFLGILVGLLVAACPRVVGRVIGVFTDATQAFPSILAVLAARAVLPPSVESFVVILVLFRIPALARLTEVTARGLAHSEFVRAAEGLGHTRFHIAITTLLPHASGPAVALAGFGISGAILAEAGLGFLGLGLPREFASLGGVLEEVRDLALIDPFVMVVPGLVLLCVSWASHASSDAVRGVIQSDGGNGT